LQKEKKTPEPAFPKAITKNNAPFQSELRKSSFLTIDLLITLSMNASDSTALV